MTMRRASLLKTTIACFALTSALPIAAEPAVQVVTLQTNQGKIEITLDAEKAPVSTANFLNYVKNGHYDGTIFHRVIPGFMIQGGGFTADMAEKNTGEPIRNESDNGLSNRRGTIAMARTSDPDSATAQFFINLVDNAFLDSRSGQPGYAVFGKVTGGMDVVDSIGSSPTKSVGPYDDVPKVAIVIEKADIR